MEHLGLISLFVMLLAVAAYAVTFTYIERRQTANNAKQYRLEAGQQLNQFVLELSELKADKLQQTSVFGGASLSRRHEIIYCHWYEHNGAEFCQVASPDFNLVQWMETRLGLTFH